MCTDTATYSLSACNKIWHAHHLLIHLKFYDGFDYDRVRFLCGSCYEAVFWICVENIVDVFIIAEQCSCKPKVFSASHSTPSMQGLGVHEFRGDTSGTADPN